uniref:Dual-specificity kinase n=1 Tax=Opuntia streptacantha TaxID=393608 RepID=A0A7C9ENL0_OPUST
MEQFRQIGEVLGSLKALMVFQNDIQINQRQCCFLLESLTLAYETIADEMRSNLRFEEKPNKWKVLEQPLKELCKIFQEFEAYIRNCFENRDWWAKALTLCNNRDSVEFHIHNLLVIMSGMIPSFSSGNSGGNIWSLMTSCSIITGAKDYQVRRRLGSGGQHKEISWLGESFVLRHIKGEIEPLIPEISRLSSLSHPNILHFLCGFKDEENTECFLVTELMSKNLYTHVREFSAQKKRTPPPLPMAVDIMLQIARGMEYLHSKEIYHGDLNPSNILVKTRSSSPDGFVHVKVAGFGLSSATCTSQQKSSSTNEGSPFIWHSPEVLTLQEESKCTTSAKYTEKSDVYSFSMICFELLTGKVPFEDGHLQGDNMGRNILAGERPLFPFYCAKYMVNITRRCWHYDPHQRPSFSSICRILRYIKRFIVMYPDQGHPDAPIPLHDYCDLEMGLLRKFPSWVRNDTFPAIERKNPVPHEPATSTERQNPILHEPIF